MYPERDYELNLVDFPGLQDTEGRDQDILHEMKDSMKEVCPQISMFVLCFERGYFDQGFQRTI